MHIYKQSANKVYIIYIYVLLFVWLYPMKVKTKELLFLKIHKFKQFKFKPSFILNIVRLNGLTITCLLAALEGTKPRAFWMFCLKYKYYYFQLLIIRIVVKPIYSNNLNSQKSLALSRNKGVQCTSSGTRRTGGGGGGWKKKLQPLNPDWGWNSQVNLILVKTIFSFEDIFRYILYPSQILRRNVYINTRNKCLWEFK